MTYLEHLTILQKDYRESSQKFQEIFKEEENSLTRKYGEIKNKWLNAMNNYFELLKFVREYHINLSDVFFN